MAAQRLAARLMVELCGARMVPGTIDVYPRPAEPRAVRAARCARSRALLGERIAADEMRRDPRAARLRRRARRRRAARRRRVPYWRDGDVQREADLIEEVAPHPRARQAADHAAGAAPGGRPADAARQRLRRRVEDALRDRGLERGRRLQLHVARRRSTALRLGRRCRCCGIAQPAVSEDQSVMRPLLLPGLLDAARHNAAHGRPAVRAVRVGARVPRAGRSTRRRRAARAARRRRTSATTSARCSPGAAGHAGAASRAAGRLLRRQGRCSRRCSAAAGVECRRVEPGEPPVPAPRPRGDRARPATSASSAGSASCTRWSRASGTSTAPVAAFEIDLDALRRAALPSARRYAT